MDQNVLHNDYEQSLEKRMNDLENLVFNIAQKNKEIEDLKKKRDEADEAFSKLLKKFKK